MTNFYRFFFTYKKTKNVCVDRKILEICQSCVESTNFCVCERWNEASWLRQLQKKMKQSSEENAAGITLEFSFRPTYTRRARTRRIRSRIQSRRSAGAFFANFHPAFASPSPVASDQFVERPETVPPFSRAIAIARRGSLPKSMTELRRSLVAVDEFTAPVSFIF